MHKAQWFFWVWMLLWACPAGAGAYYVSVHQGNDANPGTSAKPWATIQKAVESIRPGDTVILRKGIYRSDRFQLGPAGKSAKARTVFKAAPGERILLTRSDGLTPDFWLSDYMRIEGLWVGGQWTKKESSTFGVGGAPVGRGRQVIGCTIFGYTGGILVGSSENLLIQNCRIVRCGNGRFDHGLYLSGSQVPGSWTQHVIIDNNSFVVGEGYAIHGWHGPHSCIITRNFVSGFFWDLVTSGSDHLVAHNTLWRNSGQPGGEPGWNAWLTGEHVIFVNNILNSKIPIRKRWFWGRSVGKGGKISRNAYLSAAPNSSDPKPVDLRKRDQATDAWIEKIDKAIARIDAIFSQPVEKIIRDKEAEKAFAVLRQPPPATSGLRGAGEDIGLLPSGAKRDIGRTIPTPPDFWKTFRSLGLRDFNRVGQVR